MRSVLETKTPIVSGIQFVDEIHHAITNNESADPAVALAAGYQPKLVQLVRDAKVILEDRAKHAQVQHHMHFLKLMH